MTAETTITAAEWRRKAIHAGFGLFALSFRWLDWKAAAAVALAALLFNLFLLPRFGRGLYRDATRLHDPGVVAYAAMVLALVLLLRDHYLTVAAAVWAMMAFGDPAAAVAGELLGGPTLPWNRSKRWIGLVANWAAGATASILVFWFVSARPLEIGAALLLLAGAAVYAFLESVRAGIDDNLVAAIPTALFLIQLGRWPEAPLAPFHAGSWGRLATAIAVNVAAALVTGGAGLVSRSGALAGAIAGVLVMAYGGWAAYAVLWGFFLAATAAAAERRTSRPTASSRLPSSSWDLPRPLLPGRSARRSRTLSGPKWERFSVGIPAPRSRSSRSRPGRPAPSPWRGPPPRSPARARWRSPHGSSAGCRGSSWSRSSRGDSSARSRKAFSRTWGAVSDSAPTTSSPTRSTRLRAG
jgi:dolichol kinase